MTIERSKAMRRYRFRFLLAMAVYSVLIVVSLPIARGDGPMWLKVGAALLPLLPMLVATSEVLRLIGSLDELERRVQFEATSIAALLTCMGSFAWGLLETAGLPKMPVVIVLPLFCASYGVCLAIVSRRYCRE